MDCKNEGFLMKADYEKNRHKKWSWWGLRHKTDPKFYPWKKIPYRENSQHSTREIKNSTRENLSNTARENPGLPVKMFKKGGVEINFRPWKKIAKRAKKGFQGHFWFSREKKTLPSITGGWEVNTNSYGITLPGR